MNQVLIVIALLGFNGVNCTPLPEDHLPNGPMKNLRFAKPKTTVPAHEPALPQPKTAYSHGMDLKMGYMEQHQEHQPLANEQQVLYGEDTGFFEEYAALAVYEVAQHLDEHHDEDDFTRGQEHGGNLPALALGEQHIQNFSKNCPQAGALKAEKETNPPPESPADVDNQSWLSSLFWGWQ